jgi:hypothetical protein
VRSWGGVTQSHPVKVLVVCGSPALRYEVHTRPASMRIPEEPLVSFNPWIS